MYRIVGEYDACVCENAPVCNMHMKWEKDCEFDGDGKIFLCLFKRKQIV